MAAKTKTTKSTQTKAESTKSTNKSTQTKSKSTKTKTKTKSSRPGPRPGPGRPPKTLDRTCPDCGIEFRAVHERQLKCKECIARDNKLAAEKAKEELSKQKRLERAAKMKEARKTTTTCAVCGREFTAYNKTAKYCSDPECQKAARRHRYKETKSTNQQLVKVKCQNPHCPNDGYFECTWQQYRSGKKFCDNFCAREAKKKREADRKEFRERQIHENKPEQVVEMDYKPHPAQLKFHNSNARFRVLTCGIRFGKDRACIQEFIKRFAEMLSERRPTTLVPRVHGWLVAPTFPLARQLWREIKYYFPAQWIVAKNEAELRIETVMDGLIEIKSASDPDSLVSTGIDICILSEFSRVTKKEEVWGYIRGRVSSPHRGPEGKGGMVLINGTPKSRDFYYEMYCWGQDPEMDDWESWQFPSSANPYMNEDDIKAAKKTLPERIYRSEYLAEFVADGGDVFLNIGEVSTGVIQDPVPGTAYFAALDPAEKGDFSSFGIRNSKGEQVYLKRFTGVPYTAQMDVVEYYCKKYNFAPLAVDCTAAGSSTIVQQMISRGIAAHENFFTNALKAQWVSHLAVLFESKEINLLSPKVNDDTKAQMEELKSYTYTYTSTGKISYHHLPGENHHDDCVDMLLLLYKDFNSSITELPYVGLLLGANRWRTA